MALKANPKLGAIHRSIALKKSGELGTEIDHSLALEFGIEDVKRVLAIINDKEIREIEELRTNGGVSNEDTAVYVSVESSLQAKLDELKEIAVRLVSRIGGKILQNSINGFKLVNNSPLIAVTNKIINLSNQLNNTYDSATTKIFSTSFRQYLMTAYCAKLERETHKMSDGNLEVATIQKTVIAEIFRKKDGSVSINNPLVRYFWHVAQTERIVDEHKLTLNGIKSAEIGGKDSLMPDGKQLETEVKNGLTEKIAIKHRKVKLKGCTLHFTSQGANKSISNATHIGCYVKITFDDPNKSSDERKIVERSRSLNLYLGRRDLELYMFQTHAKFERAIDVKMLDELRKTILQSLWGILNELPFDSLDTLEEMFTPDRIVNDIFGKTRDTLDTDTISLPPEEDEFDLETPSDRSDKAPKITMANLRVVKSGDLYAAMKKIYGEPRQNGTTHAVFNTHAGTMFFVPNYGGRDLDTYFIKKLLRQTGLTPTELYNAIYN